MNTRTDIPVLVVAESMLSRMGLSALLGQTEMIDVVGQTSPHDLSLATIDIYRAEVIVWILGDDATPSPIFADLSLPILFLLMDVAQSGRLFSVIRPYITDSSPMAMLPQNPLSPDRLVSAISAVRDGLMVIDPVLLPTLGLSGEVEKSLSSTENLTPREAQVLQLMAEGMPNKQIARDLGISPNTVKFHVNAILSKLNAQSRTEAVIRATQLGWVLL
ncbi:MAG: response regulator transcription factor [bacterium]|nr:response regulator transcription factor [bacterium]